MNIMPIFRNIRERLKLLELLIIKTMRYLITSQRFEPFLTKWFDFENNFNNEMIVYDLVECKFTTDGKIWNDIDIDQL